MNDSRHSAVNARLKGLKVLVVEDEPVLAMKLEEMLRAIGCSMVWHATGVNEALTMMRDQRPDCAVLDLRLAGEMAYPIARWLDAERIPFIFAKGYGRRTLVGDWALRPAIQKPFKLSSLQTKLIAALDHGKQA